jgi:hypothetical protein
VGELESLRVGCQFSLQVSQQFADVFQLRVRTHVDVLVHVDLDAGGAQWQQTSSATAEVCDGLLAVEGASDAGTLSFTLTQQTGSHSINNCRMCVVILVVIGMDCMMVTWGLPGQRRPGRAD